MSLPEKPKKSLLKIPVMTVSLIKKTRSVKLLKTSKIINILLSVVSKTTL